MYYNMVFGVFGVPGALFGKSRQVRASTNAPFNCLRLLSAHVTIVGVQVGVCKIGPARLDCSTTSNTVRWPHTPPKHRLEDMLLGHGTKIMAVARKSGTPPLGNKDQNQRNPSSLLLSHTHVARLDSTTSIAVEMAKTQAGRHVEN